MVNINLYNLPISVIVNLIPLIFSAVNARKEKHYTKRSVAVTNGLLLIATGISLIIFNPSLLVYKIPLAAIPIIYGFAVVLLTSKRENLGTKMGMSLVTLILSILILVIQLGILVI